VLLGKFRFDKRIGAGGMGVVYRAVDLALDRPVAIKTLPQVSPEYAGRLRREARAMAVVSHPSLALIYGAEMWHGTPMLVCEYLGGGTLADRLRISRLPSEEALDLGLVIADVLAHIHGVGIVHCDIKPSNIGYMAGGMPKLLDFGLARLANDSQQPNRRGDSTTRSGRGAVYPTAALGSTAPTDLPPLHRHAAVHVSGGHQQGTAQHPLRPVEPVRGALRGDRGTPPFKGRAVLDILEQVTDTRRRDIREFSPDCPATLAEFFAAALARDPAARPQMAQAMRKALQALPRRQLSGRRTIRRARFPLRGAVVSVAREAMPSTTLDVPYHQQERLFFCGAAAAQMVLRGLGAPLLKQEPLYGQNHSYPTIDPASGWASPPDGLTATLERNKPSKVAATFALGVADSADAISRKIVWSIHHHRLPAVALVEGDDHWMVVHGFDVTEEPQSPDDASFGIRAFDVRDPLPPSDQLDVPPVPPHATNDGCGSGDRRGQAPQHVTYVESLDRYMTGLPSGFWQGRFLAVGDADAVPIRPGRIELPPVEHDGDRIVPPGVAADGARDGLKAFGVADRQEWGHPSRNTTRHANARSAVRSTRALLLHRAVPPQSCQSERVCAGRWHAGRLSAMRRFSRANAGSYSKRRKRYLNVTWG
jgi:serine/threonine protein kinase